MAANASLALDAIYDILIMDADGRHLELESFKDLDAARRRLPAKDMDDPEAYRGNTVGENRTAKRHDPTRQPSRPGACVVHHAAAAVEGNKSYRVEQRGDGWRSMKVPRSFNPTTRNYVDGSAHAAPPLGNERAGADAVSRAAGVPRTK